MRADDPPNPHGDSSGLIVTYGDSSWPMVTHHDHLCADSTAECPDHSTCVNHDDCYDCNCDEGYKKQLTEITYVKTSMNVPMEHTTALLTTYF